MSQNKKMVEAITPINEDFTQWYTDICLKAELVDYSTVKGCVILRPYGYAIWENIMHLLDARFKALQSQYHDDCRCNRSQGGIRSNRCSYVCQAQCHHLQGAS